MKRLLLAILLLFPVFLKADNVKVERAYSVASSFFQHSPQTRSTIVNLQMVWNGENDVKSDAESPTFYVFNNTNGKGYVIVAGDDLAQPILGYSFSSNINVDNMPVAFVSWMYGIRDEIRHARACGLKQDDTTAQKWKALEDNFYTFAGVSDMEVYHQTADWNQLAPYWDESPEIRNKEGDVEKSPTGCLITAVCIVMKYNEWPSCGSGNIPSYKTSGGITIPERPLGQPYIWDNMPLSYYNMGVPTYTPEQGAEIARLMADVGAAVHADYGTVEQGGTAASLESVPDVFATYFDYDKSMHVEYRDFYEEKDWLEKIKKELEMRPVLYTGTAKDGGHGFVLDGYNKLDFFHVNWGWGGMSNGAFKLSALDPSAQGAGGADGAFNFNQSALFNFKKNAGGEALEAKVGMIPFVNGDDTYNGIFTSATDFEIGVPFTVTAGAFLATEKFLGEVVLAVADKTEHVKQVLQKLPQNELEIGTVYWMNYDVVINQPIKPGDKLKAFYKGVQDVEYRPVYGDPDQVVMEVVLRKDALGQSIASNTSFSYNRDTHKVILNIPDDTQVRLELEGKDVTDRCSLKQNQVIIDTEGLALGTYVLVLTRNEEVKQLKFKW